MQARQFAEAALRASSTKTRGSQKPDQPATKASLNRLFGVKSGDAPRKPQGKELSNVITRDFAQQKRLQQSMLQKVLRNKKPAVEREQHLSRRQAEHLFGAGYAAKPAKGRLSFLQPYQRKRVAAEFSDAANRQIGLLRRMRSARHSQLNHRSESLLDQKSVKYDELAYQNKVRAMFGVSPKKRTPKPKLKHKKAVSKFLQAVKEEDHVKQQQQRQAPTNFLEEQTAEFHKLMAAKKQQFGSDKRNAKALQRMQQKFEKLKRGLESFTGSAPEEKPAIQEESLIEVGVGTEKNVPAKVKALPIEDEQHSSMLERVSQLFRDSA